MAACDRRACVNGEVSERPKKKPWSIHGNLEGSSVKATAMDDFIAAGTPLGEFSCPPIGSGSLNSDPRRGDGVEQTPS